MCARVCTHLCLHKLYWFSPEGGIRFPGAKVIVTCKLFDVDAGNQTGVLVLKLLGNLLPASSFKFFETKSHTVTQDDLKHVACFLSAGVPCMSLEFHF